MTKISVITENDGLEKIASAWHELLSQSVSDSIFLTWEWINAWWETYGQNKKLFLICVEDDNQLVGLIPLYREEVRRFGINCKYLRLIGEGSEDSDYLDFISSRGNEEKVVRAFYACITENKNLWDVLLLYEIPETSPHVLFLRDIISREDVYFREKAVPCSVVDLPQDWETYMHTLRKKRRAYVRSLARNLKNYTSEFRQCNRLEDLPECLNSLFSLHRKRWQMEDLEGCFSPQRQQFYVHMSKALLEKGWLRLHSLMIDGQYVAHQFGFEYANRFYALQEGFDPAWIEHDVGNVLRAHVMQDAIQRGVECYDFLGGATFHKQSWGGRVKYSLRMVVGRPSLEGFLFFRVPQLKEWAKNSLKAALPQQLLQMRQELRSWVRKIMRHEK